MKSIAQFTVSFRQILNEQGELVADLPDFAKSHDTLKKLYSHMVLVRTFDTKAINLQRTGKLGTYPSGLGEEAVGTGLAFAMKKEDVLFPSYREHAAQIYRGTSMTERLLYWGGDERGNSFTSGCHDFPDCVPISTQIGHTVGAAAAFQIKDEKRVAVGVIGDGGTSRGDFYESMNVAGTWNLPAVFVVCNNQWAISVPRKAQSACETLAQKAIAAGIYGEQVDGNDLLAVSQAMLEAVERARQGKGPSVIEAITYRMGDHTTADDAKRYRPADELESYRAKDPIVRFKQWMIQQKWWSEDEEAALLKHCQQLVEADVQAYLTITPQPLSSMFDHLYAQLPRDVQQQRSEVLAGGEHHG